MADWVWEVDLEGRYIKCSEQVESTLGYSPEEVIGKTPFDFMTEEEAQRLVAVFEELVSAKKNDFQSRKLDYTQRRTPGLSADQRCSCNE